MSIEFPEHWSREQIIEHLLKEMLIDRKKIIQYQENIMSKLDDVKAKLAKLNSDVDAFIAANTGGASDADLDALGAAIDAVDAKVAPPAAPTT